MIPIRRTQTFRDAIGIANFRADRFSRFSFYLLFTTDHIVCGFAYASTSHFAPARSKFSLARAAVLQAETYPESRR